MTEKEKMQEELMLGLLCNPDSVQQMLTEVSAQKEAILKSEQTSEHRRKILFECCELLNYGGNETFGGVPEMIKRLQDDLEHHKRALEAAAKHSGPHWKEWAEHFLEKTITK